jgi:hypothetical protein
MDDEQKFNEVKKLMETSKEDDRSKAFELMDSMSKKDLQLLVIFYMGENAQMKEEIELSKRDVSKYDF